MRHLAPLALIVLPACNGNALSRAPSADASVSAASIPSVIAHLAGALPAPVGKSDPTRDAANRIAGDILVGEEAMKTPRRS